MKEDIKVSVVIPVYNVELYIAKTIESVQAQDFDSFEIVLVDDGSLDNSGRICDEYADKDSRIRVIHQHNCGVMSARFAGVDSAKGNFIAFIDGDDRMPSSALSTFFKAITDNDVDYVNGCDICIDSFGNQISPVESTGFDGIIDGNRIYRRFIAEHPRGMNLKMYRKDILLSRPRITIDPKIKNNEDYLFNLFLSSKINRVMSIPDVVVHIVERPGSASRVKYTSDYWLFVLKWMDENYKIYDVYEDDYLLYKIDVIYIKLIREYKDVDYTLPCFDNVRYSQYRRDLGAKRNLVIFVVRNHYGWLLSLFRFHPKRWLRNLFLFI